MRIDVDLQTWSGLMSLVCDRPTPYEQLTEVDQVTDRLALEKMEELLEHLSPEGQAEFMFIINKALKRC